MASAQSKLHALATKALKKAHAPYSGYQIGAALITDHGKITSGCNIENASYGGTVCAERVAIWKAVSEFGPMKIKEICIVSNSDQPWPPCGMCLQVMAEFATAQTLIHIGNFKKIGKTYLFKELFPKAFSPTFLES